MRSPGRPRAINRATLEDAASELFLEKGYANTTVGDITQRAGVSRATFFNYFTQKSDLLWVEFTNVADELHRLLCEQDRSQSAAASTASALEELAKSYPAARVPWSLTLTDVMGNGADIRAAGATLIDAATQQIAAHVADCLHRSPRDPEVRVIAAVFTAAAVAAIVNWAGAGVTRGSLEQHMIDALAPLRAAYAHVG